VSGDGERKAPMNQCIRACVLSVHVHQQGQTVSLRFKFKHSFDLILLDVLPFVLSDLIFFLLP